MRVPNVCLVLKFDNGKVVSITHEQTGGWTEPPSSALVYRLYYKINFVGMAQMYPKRIILYTNMIKCSENNECIRLMV